MGRMRRSARTLVAGVLAAAAVLGQGALVAEPAAAATVLTVTSQGDVASNFGACGNGATTPAGTPVSLREALCAANNAGGAVTVSVPGGHYLLTSGALDVGTQSGSDITITGASAAATVIDGNNASGVFNIDGNLLGAITTTISGVTITGGRDTSGFGGGGIIDGAGSGMPADSLTVTDSVLSNNSATGAGAPGGALQMYGGALTVTNTRFTNNSAEADGSAIWHSTQPGVTGSQQLTITHSTFDNNHLTAAIDSGNAGGTVAADGSTGAVTGSAFTNNTVTAPDGSAEGVGAGIRQNGGTLTVTGSAFTNNSADGYPAASATTGSGSAVFTDTGSLTMHYNRIVGNGGTSAVTQYDAGSVADLNQNWWGCNAGANQAGCDKAAGDAGSLQLGGHLVLTAVASPATVTGPNATSTITARLTTDSLGATVSGANLTGFDASPVTFSDPAGDATVGTSAGAKQATFSSGVANIDYHSNTTTGPDTVSVSYDNATVNATVTVTQPPAFTSSASKDFTAGTPGIFTVTTSGYPTAALTGTGTLPAGVTFTDNHDGTATLAGTPTAAGSYPLTITANNGTDPAVTQSFTLNVGQPPAITSPATATFTTGHSGTFAVTTSGVPTVQTITATGTLPAGLVFADNGDGTATLSGTPDAGSGGTYPVTLTATNGLTPNGTQNLDITVQEPPQVTTDPTDQTGPPGTSVSFTTVGTGYPTPTVQWQRSTDGGATFTNIAGATTTTYTFTAGLADDASQYRAVLTNNAGTATSHAASLRVGSAPAFTSPASTHFALGKPDTFDVTVTGVPNATITATGMPSWLTLTDNGDDTATLTGTPPAGAAGARQLTLHAANGFDPAADQTFTLLVDQAPTITSDPRAGFTVGTAGEFTITTTAGYPNATSIDVTGTLPSGVTFTDHGDGTAALSGTPAAGTGGVYPLTATATADGGLRPATRQNLVLTVDEPPTISSADHTTFTSGTLGDFTLTTIPGYPAATSLAATGTLPAGVSFADNGNGTGTLTGTPGPGTGGTYPLVVAATNAAGTTSQQFTLTVLEGVTLTSADHATFSLGVAGGFTITTSAGNPPAVTLTETGALPAGVSFTDNGDGTATLAGTPTADGTYPITLTATNGVAPASTMSFRLTVTSPPAITSADHATFAVGSAGSFTVITRPGLPAATTVTATGTLPAGVRVTDNGDGTATLAGTPVVGTGGQYPVTLTAGNGISPDAVQTFTLTVTEAPHLTSVDHAAVTVGTGADFTVTSTPGWPAATTLTETGGLPSGVSFTDHGDGTATLAGTPAAGTDGSYPLTLTATNGAGSDTQSFTLQVAKADQTITVTSTPPTGAAPGDTYTPAATSDSGLPVAVTVDASSGTQVCTLAAGTVTFNAPGACVLDFDQAGDGTYADATQVQQTTPVSLVATTVTMTSSAPSVVYGQAPTVTATIGSGRGLPAGAVTFTVDGHQVGAPVALTNDHATSGPLSGLAVGSHQVTATFTPTRADVYATATGTLRQVVARAATSTTVTPNRDDVVAVVAAVPPGAGTPTGTVTFTVDGQLIGTATLSGGVATLQHTVPAGAARAAAATYNGDGNFTGSSGSTSRRDPRIVATVTSVGGEHAGWYRTPVTVTFDCVIDTAPLTAPCPAPVQLTDEGAAQSVTRTVYATDGGVATVTVTVNLDQTAPRVKVRGIRAGRLYAGHAPIARCVASDALSGPAGCTLHRHARAHGVVVFTATARDRAGNTHTVRGRYRVLTTYLHAAPLNRGGVFTVKAGRGYRLVATATHRPRYLAAVPTPRRPHGHRVVFKRAGAHRWVHTVRFTAQMRRHHRWNLGVVYGGKLHLLRVRIR